jgi:myosin heavy subunit
MNVIGIDASEQANIFRLLAAVMWLGNLTFKSQGEKAFVADKAGNIAICRRNIF